MDRIYISGPISLGGTVDPTARLAAFDKAHDALRDHGYLPVSPSIGQRSGWEWTDYMRACIALLLTCDGVAMLPGWEASRGAQVEHEVACAIGLEVFDLASWLEG